MKKKRKKMVLFERSDLLGDSIYEVKELVNTTLFHIGDELTKPIVEAKCKLSWWTVVIKGR